MGHWGAALAAPPFWYTNSKTKKSDFSYTIFYRHHIVLMIEVLTCNSLVSCCNQCDNIFIIPNPINWIWYKYRYFQKRYIENLKLILGIVEELNLNWRIWSKK
jgi:hypothetical protein